METDNIQKARKYPKANSHAVWFHCPNCYSGCTKYIYHVA